ncbi:MAG: TatD family hydrolase [Gammaproteobacteria bacterium]
MLVDSHCHLNLLNDPDAALTRARAAGIGRFLCIGVDETRIDDVLAVADKHADVWATVGQHPDVAADDLGWIRARLAHPRVVALGEMGLDFQHAVDTRDRHAQCARFEQQLELAQQTGLPIVVHTRAADADTQALIQRFPGVRGVLHCFTESWTLASAALDLGYCVSISGIVTFRNAENVRAVAARLPLDRLLVETDCPWLAPVPYRGKPNEPAYVSATAAFLATLRGDDVETFNAATSDNFVRLFPRVNGRPDA